jgi:hypothetical protein
MGYMHINNLYKDQEIMMLKECYALEKIHGTSAHIAHKVDDQGFHQLNFFAGGCKHQRFVDLFDQEELAEKMRGLNATVYGEAYGASLLKMRETYGEDLRFVAFDVKIDDCWLSVPQAAEFVADLGLEFVDYVRIPTTLEAIDAQRDRPSTQAIRNGMGDDKEREGVVLRPLIELTKNNGARLIVKHKRDKFMETKTPRKVDPEKLKILADAQAVAEEWVTPMRVVHVLDKIEDPCMEKMKQIMAAMHEDIEREGEGEIEWSPAVRKAIGKATAQGVKAHFQAQLAESQV